MIKSNLLKILITFFIVSSCNINNDTPETLATPVGKWQIEQYFEDSSDVATDCTKRTTFELKSDDTITVNYYIDSSTGNCKNIKGITTYSIEGKKLNIKVIETETNNEIEIGIYSIKKEKLNSKVDENITFDFEVTTSKLIFIRTINGVLNKVIFKKIS